MDLDKYVGNNEAEKLNNARWQKIKRTIPNETSSERGSRMLREANETQHTNDRKLKKWIQE